MPNLLCDLEIDAACWEFLARRIHARGGTAMPQPVVIALDKFCDTCEADPCVCTSLAPPEDQDEWDELTARAARYGAGPETVMEIAERMLARMEG